MGMPIHGDIAAPFHGFLVEIFHTQGHIVVMPVGQQDLMGTYRQLDLPVQTGEEIIVEKKNTKK